MELLLAVLVVVAGLIFAKRGYLNPWDYVVAAGIALTCGLAVLIALPREAQLPVLAQLGAPDTAVARTGFLLEHGAKLLLGSVVLTLGYAAGAVVRLRATPEQFV